MLDPSFDPYHKWLGIPAKDQPPTYYQLLGLQPFESDSDVIRNGAEKQTNFIRKVGTDEHQQAREELLTEIQKAKICLLKADRKTAYDDDLRKKLGLLNKPQSLPSMLTQKDEASCNQKTSSWKIGSDPSCEIRCESRSVSAMHCLVTKLGHQTFVEDLDSRNGTFVNAVKVTGKVRIFSFDLLVLGRETRIRLPQSAFHAEARPTCYGILGRNAACEVRIQHETVSQFHARCWLEKEDLFIEDLKSTNGTYLLDAFGRLRRLEPLEPTVLENEHAVQLGGFLLAISFLREELLKYQT